MSGETVEVATTTRQDARLHARRWEFVRARAPVLGAISFGGGVGAVARYGLALLLPTAPGHFPWATFITNVLGCVLMGVLMALLGEVRAHPWLRPLLGVGVLGGFTTFSTYAVEVRALLQPGLAPVALLYLVGTVVCALIGVVTGVALMRWAIAALRRLRRVA